MKYGFPLALCALLLVSVSCGKDELTTPLVLGTIEVVTVTTGTLIDGGDYTITVSSGDDERTEDVGANSSVTLSDLAAGTYALLLDGIGLRCETADNPRNVEVVASQTTPAQFDVTCAGPNLPPVADAGPNQAAVDTDNSGSEAITLDGSGSRDLDGTITNWSWSVNDVEFGTGETLTVAVHPGVYTVILTVTDDNGTTSGDAVLITVIASDENLPPIADAGPNQPVEDADDGGSELVTLDGSASRDVDGTIVSWSWSENSVEIGTGETLDATFDVGIHTVALTVTDDQGAVNSDDVTITVEPPEANLPPVADAGPDQSHVDGDNSGSELVTLDGSASTDELGPQAVVDWSWSENSAEIGTGETLEMAFEVGVHTVILTVTDTGGATATDEVTITVDLPTLAGVFIFKQEEFGGGNGSLLREDVSDLGDLPAACVGLTWDNCISSILLSGGWSATLFELAGFEGDSLIVVTSIEDLSNFGGAGFGWDNKTSSIKIRPPN